MKLLGCLLLSICVLLCATVASGSLKNLANSADAISCTTSQDCKVLIPAVYQTTTKFETIYELKAAERKNNPQSLCSDFLATKKCIDGYVANCQATDELDSLGAQAIKLWNDRKQEMGTVCGISIASNAGAGTSAGTGAGTNQGSTGTVLRSLLPVTALFVLGLPGLA